MVMGVAMRRRVPRSKPDTSTGYLVAVQPRVTPRARADNCSIVIRRTPASACRCTSSTRIHPAIDLGDARFAATPIGVRLRCESGIDHCVAIAWWLVCAGAPRALALCRRRVNPPGSSWGRGGPHRVPRQRLPPARHHHETPHGAGDRDSDGSAELPHRPPGRHPQTLDLASRSASSGSSGVCAAGSGPVKRQIPWPGRACLARSSSTVRRSTTGRRTGSYASSRELTMKQHEARSSRKFLYGSYLTGCTILQAESL